MKTFWESVFYFIGRSVCHQLPERSLLVNGLYLPVCARCTGIYLSFFTSSVYLFFKYLFSKKRLAGDKPISLFVVSVVAFSFMPSTLDGITSYLSFRESNNLIRIVTGVFSGYGLPVLFSLINTKRLISKKELAAVILIVIIEAFTVYMTLINIYIISIFLSAGVFLMFFQTIKIISSALFVKKKQSKITIISIVLSFLIIFCFSIINAKLRNVFNYPPSVPPIINKAR